MKQKSLEFLLESWILLLVVRMSVGRLFQSSGPATLKAGLSKFSDVSGTSKVLLSADRRPESCGDRL